MIGVACFCAAPGCGSTCPASERVYADGSLKKGTGFMRYETSGPSGPFIPYEGATLLHIKHGLGVRPDTVEIFLSFAERPEDVGGGGSSPAAGNQAILLKQDENEIAVKNDSCASYWIRVVATTGLTGTPTDAGTD
ncbi:MAG: hypothetical protein ACXWUG_31290 [Polyangiales bacterium]